MVHLLSLNQREEVARDRSKESGIIGCTAQLRSMTFVGRTPFGIGPSCMPPRDQALRQPELSSSTNTQPGTCREGRVHHQRQTTSAASLSCVQLRVARVCRQTMAAASLSFSAELLGSGFTRRETGVITHGLAPCSVGTLPARLLGVWPADGAPCPAIDAIEIEAQHHSVVAGCIFWGRRRGSSQPSQHSQWFGAA